jgi:GAF domain-containing protein
MGAAEAAVGPGRLHGLLLGELALDAVLLEVASTALASAPSVDSAGLTLGSKPNARSAATDDSAERLERLQHQSHEGPSWEAAHTGEPVSLPAVTSERNWPGFTAKAVQEGVAGVHSVPVVVGDVVLGALTVYSRRGPVDEADVGTIRELSHAAASVVANAIAFEGMRALVQQLNEAIESRDIIGQAKGVLMVRERIEPQEAFERLRRMSQTQNMKVRDVARQVVDSAQAES